MVARRSFAFLLLLLLLVSGTGITLSKHYCMGRLKSYALVTPHSSCCPDMDWKAMKDMGCCEVEEEVLDSEDYTSQTIEDISFTYNDILVAIKLLPEILAYTPDYYFSKILLRPPPDSGQQIFISISVFLL
jgi:hypothetical protein